MTTPSYVRQQVAVWQSKLIELNKRNPLYCLPANNRGLLPLIGQSSDDLYQFLSSARRHLLFAEQDADEEGLGERPKRKPNHREVSAEEFKKINALRLRAASAIREQGINILYLVFGVLEWTDPANHQVIRSPLVLLPVMLERLPGGEMLRLTRIDEEIELNPTLVYRLSQPDLNITLPALPEDDDFVPSAYLENVRCILGSFSTWKVIDSVVLGRFSFLKMAMYRDLERQMQRACEHPVIEALAGNPSALARLPAIGLPTLEELDQAMKGEASYSVLDADPSQQRAILAAKRGQSFVLQGPPGTGKTQTIANIIAECMASGKRVLFVSQKMAALDAVFKRLRDHRLHDLCLEAHSHKADKKVFVEQLRVAYEAQRRRIDSPEINLTALDALKGRLAEVVTALHLKRQPLGISVFDANGHIAAAADVPDLTFSLVNPHQIDPNQLLHLEELAQRLAYHHRLFSEAWAHPWREILADRFTLDLQARVRSVFNDLQTAVSLCEQQAGQVAQLCGLESPQTVRAVGQLLDAADLLALSPHPPRSWLTDDQVTELQAQAGQCRAQYTAYNEARAKLLLQWTDAILELPHAELWERLTSRHETSLRVLLGETWQDTAATTFSDLKTAINQAVSAANQLSGTVAVLATRCGLPASPTVSFCRHLLKVSEIVSTDLRPRSSWFSTSKLTELTRKADEASTVFKRFRDGRNSLLATYTEDVFQLDAVALTNRFTTEYASVTRYCRPSYYRDCRSLRQCLNPGVTLKGRHLSHDVRLMRDVLEARRWIDTADTDLQLDFGSHYTEVATDWQAIRQSLKHQSTLLSLLPNGTAPEALITRMVEAGPDIADVRELHEQLTQQLRHLEASVQVLAQHFKLTTLPFTDLPFTQASLSDFARWLAQTLAELTDYSDAHRLVRQCQKIDESTTAKTVLSVLTEASQLVQLRKTIDVESASLEHVYATFYTGITTAWDTILSGLDWTQQLRSLFGHGSLPEALIRVATEGSVPHLADIAQAKTILSTRLGTLEQQLALLSEFFPAHRLYLGEIPIQEGDFEGIREWLTLRLNRLPELEQWIDFQELSRECDRNGLFSFYETIIHRQPASEHVVPAFRKRFYQLWYDYICDAIPELRQFRGEHHSNLISQFQQLDTEQITTAPERIRSIVQQRRKGPAVVVGQMGALKKLLAAKKLKSIRKILTDIPDVLFQYKPCLLMSPLSVSLYLETEAFQFEVVIFDEASQIFIEDALCSILRAKQVIIAGDTQQLPPTPFFKSLSDDGEEDEDAEIEVPRYESILQGAGLLSQNDTDFSPTGLDGNSSQRFAEHELTWHYRSRHDTLIAFSKVHFYERIVAFPAPTSTSAVSLLRVPSGMYYPGEGKRNNPIEAAVVAEQVVTYARANPHRSIGVITFNEAQKTLIESLLDEHVRRDPELAQLLSDEGSEGFFVKNIENVQGDERDVIFLSVCFARTEDGKPSMNFGPLNKDGGERRLNVAITRARYQMTVVSSIDAKDIDLSRTDKTGPKRLKEYLEYAQSGGLSLKGETYSQSAFEAAVERAIQSKGYSTRPYVGRFGYVVALGIVHPEKPHDFVLGVECDGTIYRDAETVRARERLRSEVLAGLGWKLHRVWSCDWIRNPVRELDRIVEAIQLSLYPPKPEVVVIQPTFHFAPNDTAPQEASPADQPDFGVPPLQNSAAKGSEETLLAENLIPGTSYFEPAMLSVTWGRDTFYDDTKTAQKRRADLVIRIVEVDGPLPVEVAIQRTAQVVGITRIGPRVREIIEATIEQLITAEELENRNEFLYRRGASSYPARIARNGSPSRLIEQISLEEIGEVVIALLKVSFGMRHEELLVEVARLFGYRSTSANIRDRIGEAISHLELDSRIHVMGGQIRALEPV